MLELASNGKLGIWEAYFQEMLVFGGKFSNFLHCQENYQLSQKQTLFPVLDCEEFTEIYFVYQFWYTFNSKIIWQFGILFSFFFFFPYISIRCTTFHQIAGN